MIPPFPWRYDYEEDTIRRLNDVVMRPLVSITVVGTEVATPAFALVDSGAEHVLVAPGMARVAGLDYKSSDRIYDLGIGGHTVEVRMIDARLRLHPPYAPDDEFVEWEAEVGVVHEWRPPWQILAGQRGFLDRFTVSMSRQSCCLAIEDGPVFDDRYGIPLAG